MMSKLDDAITFLRNKKFEVSFGYKNEDCFLIGRPLRERNQLKKRAYTKKELMQFAKSRGFDGGETQ